VLAAGALALGYTFSDTCLAVGAHTRKVGTPARSKVTPSGAVDADCANTSSSMPAVCSEVTCTRLPAPSYWAMANWLLASAPIFAASIAASCRPVAPARCGYFWRIASLSGAGLKAKLPSAPTRPVAASGVALRPPLAA
jgi:hypothetical protein